MTAGRLTEPRALLLSGVGRHADPWHPFAATSAALAGLLREAGFGVETADDVDAALAGLVTAGAPGASGAWAGSGTDLPDLQVVKVGLPRDDRPSRGTPEASAGLRRWLEEGRPLLVSHVSSTSFLDSPEWEAALGGRWIRGTSMHPEYGPAEIHVHRESGRLVEGLADFELLDERYSYLDTRPASPSLPRTRTKTSLTPPSRWRTRPGWCPSLRTPRCGWQDSG